jgi:tRNA(Ile)-lysidine synthase
MQGTRTLKKVLIDLKVPVQQRITLPLLVKEGRILWIAGIRRSSEAPIGLGTNRILEVSLE